MHGLAVMIGRDALVLLACLLIWIGTYEFAQGKAQDRKNAERPSHIPLYR